MSLVSRVLAVLCGVASLAAWLPASSAAEPVPEVPRRVLALYHGGISPDLWNSRIHTRAELPLNHLGLSVRYHDLREGLPTTEQLAGVRGVLTWFEDPVIDEPAAFLAWARRIKANGRKIVVIGESGLPDPSGPQNRLAALVAEYWALLGIKFEDRWESITYDVELIDPEPLVVGFERPLDGAFAGYPIFRAIDPKLRPLLQLERRSMPVSRSVVVATGPSGGFAAGGFALYEPRDGHPVWLIDPFEFFRRAFDTDDLPKPDTTTLSGRRIFYSHIDGDGWRNKSEIPAFADRGALSTEVILEEVLKPYPDLPVTVGPVVADLDPRWAGTAETLRLARAIFALPHIEAGSHTYSHPLDWAYLGAMESAGGPPGEPVEGKDKTILGRDSKTNLGKKTYSRKPSLWNKLQEMIGLEDKQRQRMNREGYEGEYESPRSFEDFPYELEREIDGSVAFIETLLPAGKRVTVVQWSGDTTPYAGAIAATRRLGLRNINGGDSRFDREFPSYAAVSPLGREFEGQIQIYASNSNENTYTDLWTDRYFGFIHLVKTIRNTEIPRRIKPFNVYFHMYSGQKTPSLRALLANMDHARSQSLIPIRTSEYAAIGDGFFSAGITRLGTQRWQISNRQELDTVRFDHATHRCVDWNRSRGVLGQIHRQGSLYVALDSRDTAPVIALTRLEDSGRPPAADHPYLIESRWRVSALETLADGSSFLAQGFGAGEMSWRMPGDGVYRVVTSTPAGVIEEIDNLSTEQGILRFALAPGSAIGGLRVHILAQPSTDARGER